MPCFLRVTLAYLGGLLLCVAFLAGAAYLAETYAGISLPGSAPAAISALVAAMIAGLTLVRRTGARPPSRLLWGFSLWFAILQFAIGGAILVAIGFFGSDSFADMAAAENFTTIAAVLMLAMFALTVLLSRLGLGIGVKNGLRAIEHAARR